MSYLFSELQIDRRATHKGPQRKFGPFHYYRALKEIASSGRTGRARIARSLEIGEGSARTLLDQLEDAALITRNNAGIVLTGKGGRLIENFPVKIVAVRGSSLSTGPRSSLAIVKGRGSRVSTGIAQRDAAIKNGGDGAITMIVRKGALVLPPDFRTVDDEHIRESAFSTLGAVDGDALVLGSGQTAAASEMATFFSALTLL